MEDTTDKTRLIIGIIVFFLIVALGFFLLRGFFNRQQPGSMQGPTATSYQQNTQTLPSSYPTPTNAPSKSGQSNTQYPSNGSTGSTGSYYYVYPTTTYTQSSSQSQSGSSSGSMSQSQTLNGSTQSQN